MYKNIVAIAAAITVVSMGTLVSAQAGGSTSAPSKYSGTPQSVKRNQVNNHLSMQSADYRITEFSSSSARPSAPKR
jgi:hypothetical protein